MLLSWLQIAAAISVYLAITCLAILDRLGRTAHHLQWRHGLWTLALFVTMVFGIWLTFTARNALERGVVADRWSVEELRHSREKLSATWLTLVAYGSALIAGVLVITDLFSRWSHHVHGVALGAFSFLLVGPLTSSMNVRRMVAEPKVPHVAQWKVAQKPLTSEHWGERRAI